MFVETDEVTPRAGSFARHPGARLAARVAFCALQFTPIPVRITFDRP